MGVRDVLQGVCADGNSFHIIDVGDEPPHVPGPGGGVKHRLDRWITGSQSQRLMDGIWEYPPVEAVM